MFDQERQFFDKSANKLKLQLLRLGVSKKGFQSGKDTPIRRTPEVQTSPRIFLSKSATRGIICVRYSCCIALGVGDAACGRWVDHVTPSPVELREHHLTHVLCSNHIRMQM